MRTIIVFLLCTSIACAQKVKTEIDLTPVYDRISEVEVKADSNTESVASILAEIEKVKQDNINVRKIAAQNKLAIDANTEEISRVEEEHSSRLGDLDINLSQTIDMHRMDMEDVNGRIRLLEERKNSPLAFGATLENHDDDDAPAIMRCLEENGICILPRGQLSIATPILVKDNQKIVGHGKGISVLRVVDNCDRVNTASSWFPVIQSYSFQDGHVNNLLEDFSVDLNGDNNNKEICLKAVNLWGDNHTVRNVEAYGFRSGLRHEAFVIAISRGNNPIVEGCEIHSPASTEGVVYPSSWIPEFTALYIYSENGIGIIRNNKILNLIREGNLNGTHGISVGGNMILATGNVMESVHAGFWIQMPQHGNYTISNNQVRAEKAIVIHDAPNGYILDKITIANNVFESSSYSLHFYATADPSRSVVKRLIFKDNVCHGVDGIYFFPNRANAYEHVMIVDNIIGDFLLKTNHGWTPEKWVLKHNMKLDGGKVKYTVRSSNTGNLITQWED